jgi:hypothetical protein
LRYQSNFAAGKNVFLNSNFSVWQRGTSFSTAGAYTADRWIANSDTSFTLSRQTFTPGTAPVAGYEGEYYARFVRSAGGSYGTGSMQKIEDVRTFAGQTVTLSFWAKADAAITISPYYNQIFGSGGSTTVGAAIGAGTTLTTSWARYSLTFTLPSISGKTIGTSSHIELYVTRYIGAAATTIDLWGVQLEAGSVATAFQTATGTIQGELAACRYYYRRWALDNSAPLITGMAISTTEAISTLPLDLPMRIAPSSLEYASLQGADYVANKNFTAASISSEQTSSAVRIYYSGATGLTQYRPYIIRGSASGAYLAISAEL